MGIEETAAKFSMLAKKAQLTKAELEEAKDQMVILKEAGMTNAEISKLSGGKWSIPTVKGYTGGVQTTNHGWQDAVGALTSLMSSGHTLEDVKTTSGVLHQLKQEGTTIGQVSVFLSECGAASVKPGTLIGHLKEMKATGFSPGDLMEALTFKKELHSLGLPAAALPPLVTAAKNLGKPSEVLHGLSQYKTLMDLGGQIEGAEEQAATLAQKNVKAASALQATEAKLSGMQKQIGAYQQAVSLGFGEKQLIKIHGLAKQYGGVPALLDGMGAFDDYSAVIKAKGDAEAAMTGIKGEISQRQAQYAHIKTATHMCLTLMDKYDFGIDAIGAILALAKKFGEPMQVLQAVEKIGQIKLLEDELARLEGNVEEKTHLLAQLEGRCEAALNQVEGLTAAALKAGKEVSDAQHNLASLKETQQFMTLITNPKGANYQDYRLPAAAMTSSMREWVIHNRVDAPFTDSITNGLGRLFSVLTSK